MKTNNWIKQFKLWIYLYQDDITKCLKILPLIALSIYLMLNFPRFVREYYLSRLDAQTIGVIESINKLKGIAESQTGGRIVTKTYEVNFHFHTESQQIQGKEFIDRLSLNLRQKALLNNLQLGDTVLIKYSSLNPNNSRVKIE